MEQCRQKLNPQLPGPVYSRYRRTFGTSDMYAYDEIGSQRSTLLQAHLPGTSGRCACNEGNWIYLALELFKLVTVTCNWFHIHDVEVGRMLPAKRKLQCDLFLESVWRGDVLCIYGCSCKHFHVDISLCNSFVHLVTSFPTRRVVHHVALLRFSVFLPLRLSWILAI